MLSIFFAEHIVKTLEIFSVQLQVDYEWVFKAILSIGISLSAVLEVYHKWVYIYFAKLSFNQMVGVTRLVIPL